jgi:hypothetical protein
MPAPTPAELEAKLIKLETNMDRLDSIVNGDEDSTTTVDNALVVPSLANTMARVKGILKATWAAPTGLAAVVGQYDGQRATVDRSDVGTHTDPVVGGTVNNAGNYSWDVSGAGSNKWRWVSAGDFADEATTITGTNDNLATNPKGVKAALDDRMLYEDSSLTTGHLHQIFGNDDVLLAYFDRFLTLYLKSLGISGNGLTILRDTETSSLAIFQIFNEHNTCFLEIGRTGKLRAVGMADVNAALTAALADLMNAYGARDTLTARLNTGLTPEGVPLLAEFNRETLRQCHSRLAMLKAGLDTQLNMGFLLDSWSAGSTGYVRMLQDMASADPDIGDAGGGWTAYNYWYDYTGPYSHGGLQPTGLFGNLRPADYGLSLQGAWQRIARSSPAPNLGYIYSSTPGDEVRRTIPATPHHHTYRLIWLGSDDGVIEYSINSTDSGDFVEISTVETGDTVHYTDIALPGDAENPVASTVRIRVKSGTPKLCGDRVISDARGFCASKHGFSGARVDEWIAPNATQQIIGFAAMGNHAWGVCAGTNEQGLGTAPATRRGQMSTFINSRLRPSGNKPDILLMTASENQGGRVIPMSDYAIQDLELACEIKVAYRNMQPAHGDLPADYAFDGPAPMYIADGYHPNEQGHYSMMAAVAHMIFPY